MVKIQVLGAGCPKCRQLAVNAEAAVQQLGLAAAVEKVTDINTIMASGIMMTPALVIDGKVRATGKLLSVEEIRKLLAGSAPQTGS